jgi:hypothetical protein
VVAPTGSLPVGGRQHVATPAARGGQIQSLTVDWKAPTAGWQRLLRMEGDGGCGQPGRP